MNSKPGAAPAQGSGYKYRGKSIANDKPTPRQEFRLLFRHRIIAASIKCFKTGGYGATTLETIAKEAGISRTAIYQHFRFKSEILYEAILEIEPLWLSAFTEALPLQWRSENDVHIGTAKMFEMYRDNITFLRVILEAASMEAIVSDYLEGAFQKHTNDVSDKLLADSKKTPLEQSHFRMRIWIAVTAMDNVFRRVLDPRWSLNEQVAIDEIARMWMGLIEPADFKK